MKSYLELTQSSAIMEYVETLDARIEIWMDDNYIYKCVWFLSNDAYLPNTIHRNTL